MIRLDKYISEHKNITRKEAKTLIKSGKIKIDGKTVSSPEYKFDETAEKVSLGEKTIDGESLVYIIMNKPAGFVCASEDKKDKTVFDILPQSLKRKGLFTMGRLDKDTTGLLIITNDGELSHRLLSPKHHVNKEYYLEGTGEAAENAPELFEEGLSLGRLKLKPAELKIISSEKGQTKARLTISEGKFHQVKRMMYEVGVEVTYLKRISFAGLSLPGDLNEGEARPLTEDELKILKQSAL
ncbi:MAG: rRNA pseudouridine synthase [Clostridiales bacterium]|nr:rRNA pseudouridine synthase [Clostridiales bacterium]